MSAKQAEYNRRYEYWSEKAITQLGYSLHLFTTIGITSLGYLISIRKEFPKLVFNCNLDFDFNLFFYFSSILLILTSIVYGFISILSRLYDFRLTRHLALSRKRFLKRSKEREDNGLILDKIINEPRGKNWKYFKKIICKKINFINENDIIEKSRFLRKFKKIQIYSKVLGTFSWKTHKIQILLFVIGIISYGITVF